MDDDHAIVRALPPLSDVSLFLDFDGTLVDLADTPDGIAVPPDLAAVLSRLDTATRGALAVVSGRAVEDMERFLPDYRGTLVGGHGAEMRRDGRLTRHPVAGGVLLARLTDAVEALAGAAEGLLAERKATGAVLHYRRAPEREAWVQRELRALAEATDGFEAHQAKMAVELRPDDIGKDRAVAALMAAPPFAGRLPVFAGDDATDEPAMALCVQMGGTAVKVGQGASAAPLRAGTPAIMNAVLAALAAGKASP